MIPLVLFSLFATKLLSYLLPAAPGTVLLLARAGARGWLDDAAGRRSLRATAGALGIAALGVAGVLAGRRLLEATGSRGCRWSGSPRPTGWRRCWRRWPSRRVRWPSAACVCGTPRRARSASDSAARPALRLAFHAFAPALPTLREPARLVRQVPDARLIQHGTFSAGMLFYTGATRRTYVAANSHFCTPPPQAGRAQELCLRRRDSLALLRAPAPTFAWVDAPHAAALAEDSGAWVVYGSREAVLLANRAARERLAAELSSQRRSP